MAHWQPAERWCVPSFPSVRQWNGSWALPRLRGTMLLSAGGDNDSSLFLSCAWDKPHKSCVQARQTAPDSCPAWTALRVDGWGQSFSCLPSHLGQVKKHMPGTLIFSLKPYFLCSLNYILAWRYLFSVTQINACFNYLCQTECRENSGLVEIVGFTAVEMEPSCPTHQLLEGLVQSHAPFICPSRGQGPCLCHPHKPVHVCTLHLRSLPATFCNAIPAPRMLDTRGCNTKFSHCLKVQFIFKMHFRSALGTPHR